MATYGHTGQATNTNYAAYIVKGQKTPRIGHLNLETQHITELVYKSGAPVSTLYEVIEAGDDAFAATDVVYPVGEVKLLPPISGRDVLAVGKNYVEHAKEFNESGYDASDKTDQPTHPVIFTKRATSIIAHGDEIYPHKGFTESVDYEGEIGVIIGKPGFQVSEADAPAYVWGYTIINDVTARERQRDHKQFYIGKSPDTFCPIGPIAVPKEHLPQSLKVQTSVNGEKRQEATIDQLIFSVPFLIKTLSEGQTLQVGDVIATGTPAGVGFGFRPMIFLKPGDEVSVSVTGLGTLTNRIGSYDANNATVSRVASKSHVPLSNSKSLDVAEPDLLQIGPKQLFYRRLGTDAGTNITFIHGLGGTHDYFAPLVPELQSKNTLHLLDLEGHGLSPTSSSSVISIGSYADDIAKVLESQGVHDTVVVAHSMGCLVAGKLALEHPQLVKKLVLMGPPPSPLPEPAVSATMARAKLVRTKGIMQVADALATTALSEKTKTQNRLAVAAVRISLLGQHPEGYAKACTALASAPELDLSKIACSTLLLTGTEDKVSPPDLCKKYQQKINGSRLSVLDHVGHWHLFEDDVNVTQLVATFLA